MPKQRLSKVRTIAPTQRRSTADFVKHSDLVVKSGGQVYAIEVKGGASPHAQKRAYKELIAPYSGQWVAIRDGKVVAHGANLGDVVGRQAPGEPPAKVLYSNPE